MKMTIIHLTTVHTRDDTRIFIKEAQTLASHLTNKVWLMVADGKGNVDEEQGQVSIHDIGRLGDGRLGRVLIGTWRAFFAIRRFRRAIVHFHDPELIPLGLFLKIFGYKVIYDVHEDMPRDIMDKHWISRVFRHPIAWIMTFVEWVGAQMFDAIVPVTSKIADRFPAHKTVLVQNFPITEAFMTTETVSYNQRDMAFAYAGGISELRGAREMVQAVGQLNKTTRARLELAGDYSPASLEAELHALPDWDMVTFHGYIDQLQLIKLLGNVRAGLVLLHPTLCYIDAYPIKMFEYMAVGLPVIASDFPIWREIIDGANCGLLIDPLDVTAIAEAMQWILEHPADAEEMGKNGMDAVRLKYTWQSESRKLLDLYEHLKG